MAQDEDLGSWLLIVLGSVVGLALCAAVGYYVWARIVVTKSVVRADAIELSQTFKRWVEAGRPEGEKLTKFMEGRREDLIVTNRSLTVGETSFTSQFALTNLHLRQGVLFIGTNGTLVWQPPSGQAQVVSVGPGR